MDAEQLQLEQALLDCSRKTDASYAGPFKPETPPPAIAYFAWAVAALFYTFDVALRMAPGVLMSHIQRDFDATASAISSALSSSFLFGYAAAQVPIGCLLDYQGHRATLAQCALLVVAGLVVSATATSLAACAAGRLLQGLGCGVGWIGILKVLRTHFGEGNGRVGLLMGCSNVLCGVGGMVAQGPFHGLVRALGWRAALLAAAAVPLLTVLLGACTPAPATAGPGPAAWGTTTFREVVTRPRSWGYCLYMVGIDAPFETLCGLWGAAFVQQALGYSAGDAARAQSLTLVVGTLSMLAFGPLAFRLRTRKRQTLALAALAVMGLVGVAPLCTTAPGSVVASHALIGLSIGAASVFWTLVSADPLCEAGRSAGYVGGVINSGVMGLVAVVQWLFGCALQSRWGGGRGPTGAPVYPPEAFAGAFHVLAGAFGVAAALACAMWAVDQRSEVEREPGAAPAQGSNMCPRAPPALACDWGQYYDANSPPHALHDNTCRLQFPEFEGHTETRCIVPGLGR